MDDRKNYELYLDEKFRGIMTKIDSEFEVVNTRLDNILSQVTRTNGRVTELEKKVNELEKQDIMHVMNCPQASKIEDIRQSLLEYNFVMKYPKLTLTVLGAISLILFALLLNQFA